ncbi:MAG: hypothetical protein ACOH2J_03755 [Allorhizobium sp.]
MKTADVFRVGGVAGILMGCLALSGCIGGPTYGTDKTAMEQLTDDLGSAVSIGSKAPTSTVKYNPRPSLVLPPKTAMQSLSEPQQSLASKDNPQWLESPEDSRARLVAEADANADNPNYRSPLLVGYGTNGTMTEKQKWEAFREARKVQKGAYIDQRRYLADPPSEFRRADETVLTDVGEPELKKEKRRKKEAASAKKSSSWWMPFQ